MRTTISSPVGELCWVCNTPPSKQAMLSWIRMAPRHALSMVQDEHSPACGECAVEIAAALLRRDS